DLFDWWESKFDSIKLKTTNYQDPHASGEVDALYCAVPHNLQAQFYTDSVRAGNHMLGEKPFGIDIEANRQIIEVINQNPNVVVACSSEFPFFPAAQHIIRDVNENRFGKIIEVSAGLLHSSDLD